MPDQDIFKETTKETQPQTETEPQTDPFVDKLKEIKNEEGEQKYKDTNTALNALQASQQFIEQLKSEKRLAEQKSEQLEADLRARKSVEDLLDRSTPTTQPQETPKTSDTTGALSEKDVVGLFEKQLAAREANLTAEANLNQVITALKSKFGDQAATEIKRKSEQLGTTPEDLQGLSKKNPQLVLTLFETDKGKVSDVPVQSSLNHTSPTKVPNTLPKVEKGKGATAGGLTSQELLDMWGKAGEYVNNK